MISGFWFLLSSIAYVVFLILVPVSEISANGVARPIWEERVGESTLVMLTSPFPPAVGSLHVAVRLDPIDRSKIATHVGIPIFLTISPGQELLSDNLEPVVENLKLSQGTLGQYHANVFLDHPGEWIFMFELVLDDQTYHINQPLVVVETQLPKIPLLTITVVVLVFTLGYLAWWVRSRKRSEVIVD